MKELQYIHSVFEADKLEYHRLGPMAFLFFIELIIILISSGVVAVIKNESVLEDER